MAAVMIKLNTRARALAPTAPLALVLGLRGGVTFALGRPWATCPIIAPTGNSPLPYLYLTYRDEPELTYPLRRHGHQPRRLAASSGFFPSGRATANRLTVPINSCTRRTCWCS